MRDRNYDDPYEVAVQFCRKNRLNELAVQIVENKIVEAKRREEDRLQEEGKRRDSSSFKRTSLSSNRPKDTKRKESLNNNAYTPNDPNKSFQNQSKQGKIVTRSRLSPNSPNTQAKNIRPKQAERSKAKQQNKKMEKEKNNKSLSNIKQSKPSEPKKATRQVANHLYARAMVKMKMKQSEREKIMRQRMQEQSRQLTFQPKINSVSAKIVVRMRVIQQFRKEAGEETAKDREKENKKTASNELNLQKQMEEIKHCTFKPQINRVSQLITQNRNAYKDQFDHFTLLYKQAEEKREKMASKGNQSGGLLFQPKINTRSSETIMDTFEQRLEKSIIKKKEIKQGLVSDSVCSFQPKIGRAPKISKPGITSSSSNEWWNQLHNERSRKAPLTVLESEQVRPTFTPQISTNSLIYFQNLVEKRIVEVFKALDSDEDGFISPEAIAVQNLTKWQLIFLKPLFEEIEDLEAHLDFTEFKKALSVLLNESDVHSRGQFLCEKPHRQERTTFTPAINKKSRELTQTRVQEGVEVFQKLYEKGLKDLQKKQYQNQRIRQQQQQQQLQQCSFKPLLNNTSKYYIDKVLGKKISKLEIHQQHH